MKNIILIATRIITLGLGIGLTAYWVATPGVQPIASLLSGMCVASYVLLGEIKD